MIAIFKTKSGINHNFSWKPEMEQKEKLFFKMCNWPFHGEQENRTEPKITSPFRKDDCLSTMVVWFGNLLENEFDTCCWFFPFLFFPDRGSRRTQRRSCDMHSPGPHHYYSTRGKFHIIVALKCVFFFFLGRWRLKKKK